MKFKFDELLGRTGSNLYHCIMGSLTGPMIDDAQEKREFDIKLVVNGVDCEPTLLGDLLDNIEKHVENAGRAYAREKLNSALQKANNLEETVEDAIYEIKSEFNLFDSEYD